MFFLNKIVLSRDSDRGITNSKGTEIEETLSHTQLINIHEKTQL